MAGCQPSSYTDWCCSLAIPSLLYSFNILSVQKIFQLLTKIYCDISVTIREYFPHENEVFFTETAFNLCKTTFNLYFLESIHFNSMP